MISTVIKRVEFVSNDKSLYSKPDSERHQLLIIINEYIVFEILYMSKEVVLHVELLTVYENCPSPQKQNVNDFTPGFLRFSDCF